MPLEWGHCPDRDDQMIRVAGMRGNPAIHGGEEVISKV